MTWPSAFQYIDAPLNDCYQAFVSKEKSLKRLGKCYLGMVLLPITLVYTHLLMLTDIVTGMSEAAFHTYKSGLNNETGKILYK